MRSGCTENQLCGGGVIYNDGTLTLINSTVWGNTANNEGGGIYNQGTMTITSSTISGNTVARDGGDIYNGGSEMSSGNADSAP